MKDQKKHKKRCGNCDHFMNEDALGKGNCERFEIATHCSKCCKNHSGLNRGKK